MPRRTQRTGGTGLDRLASETAALVGQLMRENRALKAENAALRRELDQLAAGWREIERVVRTAPRRRRARSA